MPQPRTKVLIIQHSDGFVECFADPKSTDIRILQLWPSDTYDVGDVDNQIETGTTSDMQKLPAVYRDLHRADFIRDTGYPRYKSRPGDWWRGAVDRFVDLVNRGVIPNNSKTKPRALAADLPNVTLAADVVTHSS